MSFATRLNRLFDAVYPPGRKPYTSADVVAGLRAMGATMSAPYLSQLRSGKRDNPSPATIAALADFFEIDRRYFTDDSYAAQLDTELHVLAERRAPRAADPTVELATGRHRVEEPPATDGSVPAEHVIEEAVSFRELLRRVEDRGASLVPVEIGNSSSVAAPESQVQVASQDTASPATRNSPASERHSHRPSMSDVRVTIPGSTAQGSSKVVEPASDGRSAASSQPAVAPSPFAEKGRRLFQFLADAQRLKIPRITSLDTYKVEGAVLWASEIPTHEHVALVDRELPVAASSDLVLTADRTVPQDPPAVPVELGRWLVGSVSDPLVKPELKPRIPQSISMNRAGAAELLLEDHPDVQAVLASWLPLWEAWAEQSRHDQRAIDLYQTLFASYMTLSDHPEEFELILAVGCLVWAPRGAVQVKRHLLTTPAEIEFDDRSAKLTVRLRPHLENIKVELDMLETSQITAQDHVSAVRDEARICEHHPLDREISGELLRRLVFSLDSEARYHDVDQHPTPMPVPQVAFAPALIMRKRSRLGLLDIFEKIDREIAESGEVPSGLLPLLNPDFEPRSEPVVHDGALVQIEDEVLSPLPLNSVQLDVLRAVDSRAQTVVQGPPGTGKTHTAAALLAHLLAQGKCVLVTAQSDQALKEVRGKLPDAIKPLAVAVIGSGQSDMADLKVAVERIASESTTHNARQAEARIEESLGSIDRLRRERAVLRSKMVEVRTVEVDVREFAGYRGTLAQIALKYEADAARYAWAAELLSPNVQSEFPLTTLELQRVLALLRDSEVLANEQDAALRLVEMNELPAPSEVSTLIDTEASSSNTAAQFARLKEYPAFADVTRLSDGDRAALRDRMRELARTAKDLEQRREQWIAEALADIRSGRGATWATRANKICSMAADAEPLVQRLSEGIDVTVLETVDCGALEAMARTLREHVAKSGPVKTNPDGSVKIGALTNRIVKCSRPLFDAVRVNRRVPTTVDELGIVLDHFEAEQRLDALDRAWPSGIDVPHEDTHWERLQWHKTELGILHQLIEFAGHIEREADKVSGLGLTPPDWTDTSSILRYSELVDAVDAQQAYTSSALPLEALASVLAQAVAWGDTSGCVQDLHSAVAIRDQARYRSAHSRLKMLHSVRSRARERDELLTRFRVSAPKLAIAVTGEPADTAWDERLSEVVGAWNWLRTGAWISTQQPGDINTLQAHIESIDGQLRQHISSLAAMRAWMHAVAPTRLTGSSRADLVHYAQQVRRLGKGTGKYAAQRRADIRNAMIRCREAVPVWIMPLYRIADQLDVTQNMFDVVLVDEASQAGLEASFLQYLAPKIVVIGDDKQVSPAAVGVDLAELHSLATMYLRDDPHRAAWEDPKQSYFDEAVKRFGSRLTLVEHRRCVPEIIGFSNRIAYEPENIKLQPVRQYGSDRLEPLKAVRIVDGYQQGKTNKTNPPEVDAIVEQVLECLADPRYDGKTMGIISLQGPHQALAIRNALMPKVDPKEWTARELRCGDAASFQGSERDVMFLSMVASRDEDKRLGASVGATYVQRYNVACSRAKDQQWLFHSIDIHDVPNSEDVRNQLLDYSYGVIGRRQSAGESGISTAAAVPEDIRVEPFDSLFEQRVYNRLMDRGLNVEPQYETAGYRIDLVVVGSRYRLAVECDGDAWHGPKEYERDLARQRDLERCGWTFFRIRESEFYIDQHGVLSRLWEQIAKLDAVAVQDVSQPAGDRGAPLSDSAGRTHDGVEPIGPQKVSTEAPIDMKASEGSLL